MEQKQYTGPSTLQAIVNCCKNLFATLNSVDDLAEEVAYISSEDNETITDVETDGSNGGANIDVVASVGQTIVVKEVDANGKPTAWESADYQPRTHWEEEVVCMPEATYGATQLTIETSFVPVVGESYKVIWNGVEYVCGCFTVTEENVVAPCLGNIGLSGSEYENTGEPFFLTFGDGACVRNLVDGNVSPDTFSITHLRTTKIPPKYLPEGIGYSEKTALLPETTIVKEGYDGTLPTIQLTVGGEYTIHFNGVEYVSTCILAQGAQIIGNTPLLLEEGDNGCPLIVVTGPVGENGELGTIIEMVSEDVLEGIDSFTISIIGDVVHTIPEKYIPKPYVYEIDDEQFKLNGTSNNGYYSVTVAECPVSLLKAIVDGSPVFVNKKHVNGDDPLNDPMVRRTISPATWACSGVGLISSLIANAADGEYIPSEEIDVLSPALYFRGENAIESLYDYVIRFVGETE